MTIRKLGTVYKTLLRDHPFIVQSLQAGVLMGTGDLLAQSVIERKPLKQIQPKRTAQFCMLGMGLVGPVCTTWYRVLSKLFGDSGKSVALKKVAVDQLLFSPSFTVVFLTGLNFIQGHDFEYLKKQLNTKYVDIMTTNYKFWPAVQLGNFYLVPLNYQTLLVQTVALFWNAYISWKTQQEI